MPIDQGITNPVPLSNEEGDAACGGADHSGDTVYSFAQLGEFLRQCSFQQSLRCFILVVGQLGGLQLKKLETTFSRSQPALPNGLYGGVLITHW